MLVALETSVVCLNPIPFERQAFYEPWDGGWFACSIKWGGVWRFWFVTLETYF